MTDLPEGEIAELREMFNLVDKDGGGSISNEELKDLMDTVGIKARQQDVDKMIKEIDQDSNGEVDFEEFVAVMSRKINQDVTQSQVREAFDFFSATRDGTISKNELRNVLLTECKNKLTIAQTRTILEKLKFGPNDEFDYVEYVQEVLPDKR